MPNTTTIIFRGHSDDTFGWSSISGESSNGDDHDDCANGTVRTYELRCGQKALAVTGVYGQACMWSVGIAPLEDDDVLPDWPMQWSFEDYSTVLEIDVPEGVEPVLIQPESDEAREKREKAAALADAERRAEEAEIQLKKTQDELRQLTTDGQLGGLS